MTDQAHLDALALALMYPAQAFAEEPETLDEAKHLISAALGGHDVGTALSGLLLHAPGLNEWVEKLLEDPARRPPEYQPDLVRGYSPAPGAGAPALWRYTCSVDGIPWYRISADDVVPRCSICGHDLVPG